MEKFLLTNFLNGRTDKFHLARTTINSRDALSMHSHNYAEIFWIKSGRGIHCINGTEITINQGTLCMIRPDDLHTFKLGKKDSCLIITNIAFRPENLDYYKKRYFPHSKTQFWSEERLPFCIQLETSVLNELSARADQWFSEPRDQLQLDYIMLYIFRLINNLQDEQSNIPHWLMVAMNHYNHPGIFLSGIRGFVKLTGHSTAHVNRTLKKHLNQTLTETVIKLRLAYASQQLIMTNTPVKSIAADCGFHSLSYFYRLFKKYTGYTPREYRKMNHKII